MQKLFSVPFASALMGAATLVASAVFQPVEAQSGSGSGSDPYVPLVDWESRLGVEERLQPLGDDLMGDQIDPHTGSVSFVQTDISLPGNSDLEVALVRRISQGVPYGVDEVEFGDWEYVVPRLKIVTAEQEPWTGNRCTDSFATQFGTVTIAVGTDFQTGIQRTLTQDFTRDQYASALMLEVGGSSEAVLENPRGAPWPTSAVYVTNSNWYFTCLGNDRFLGHAPDGATYRFDRHIVRDAMPMSASNLVGEVRDLKRDTHILAATEVTDRHGNWVRYTYDTDGRLTRIHANDGREITLAYTGSSHLVQSATANGRTWTYAYRPHTITGDTAVWMPPAYQGPVNDVLSDVTLPDGRSWSFTLDTMLYENRPTPACGGPAPTVMSVTHPSGAVGEFTIERLLHRHSYDQQSDFIRVNYCPIYELSLPGGGGQPTLVDDVAAPIIGITRKELISPDAPTATWIFEYEQDLVGQTSLSDPTNWTRITGPNGHETAFHNWRSIAFGGAHTRTEVRETASGPILESAQIDYVDLGRFGDPANTRFSNQPFETKPRRSIRTTTIRDGTTYTAESDFITDDADPLYSWGNPVELRSFSDLTGATTRTIEVDYAHDTTDWVLGLVDQVTRNGKVFEDITYNAANLPTTIQHFGVTVETRDYNADGTLAWVRDALNRQTTFANYKRSFPQTITRADGTQITVTVDDNGWITSLTDARGTTTGYDYTASGWLELIDRPSGYDDTSISYTSLGLGVVATSTTGALSTITEHDRFHRPLRVERRALSGGGGSVFTRFEYDALGRTVFASFPSTGSNPTTGATTNYDALGRVTRVEENVAPFAATVTDYLSDNRVRVTDPMGNITTTWRSGYGGPDDGETIQIDHPLGLTTAMTHDAWGNMLTARQWGTHSGFTVDETQSWTYDAQLRVCRHITAETGATQFTYDAAGQMHTVARGLSPTAACGTAGSATTTVHGYNLLGQLVSVDYPDASPDVAMSYDANGNLATATRGITAWTYNYDVMDRLIDQSLVVEGRTYLTSYSYESDGRPRSTVLPDNNEVFHLPNGFGQPTAARIGGFDHASNAVYHPSGQLETMDYGNGMALTHLFNARQQITDVDVLSSSFVAFDHGYLYDANGRITDILVPRLPSETRAFTYDALGRLSTATGPWGAGSYTYDLLNNIRSKSLGADTVEIEYNAANQISRARDTRDGNIWRTYAHDGRGNVIDNDRIGFTYDRSDQPVAMSGLATGSYAYDAHNRRVKQTIDGETIYSVYGVGGELIFRDNITTGEETAYITVGGRSVARLVTQGVVTTTTYIHNDHLGSSSMGTTAAGGFAWWESYTPFGETRNNFAANEDNQGFTGHIHDTATGLTYMQARYYDPVIGRFLSNDPVGFASGGPGYFNRYAYTFNDPVNHTDPSGMCGTRIPDHAGVACSGITSFENGTIGGGGGPSVNVSGLSSNQEASIRNAVNDADSVFSNSSNAEMRAAWASVVSVDVGPSAAVNNGVVVQGNIVVDVSGDFANNIINVSNARISISSEAIFTPGGAFNVEAFHTIFSHEVGHATRSSIGAYIAGDLTGFENQAEWIGRAAAIEGGLLRPGSAYRVYTSRSKFVEFDGAVGQALFAVLGR